jgi:hypothetical protein
VRSGIEVLEDAPGTGALVERQRSYRIRLQMWLNKGEPIRWAAPWGPVGRAFLEDDGQTLTTEVRIDRRSLINGMFYGIEGMRVGGVRKLKISPHLGYRDRGVPGVIPSNAVLIAEIAILEERA